MSELQFHPIADLFPMMDESAFAELVADISEHGLHEPIIIHEGKILDGRNRYRACLEADIEPRFERYDGEHPVAFVISLNLHRRHLNESQRGMVAARLAKMERGSNQHTSIDAPSRAEAASLLNVSPKSVERAKTVLRSAVPELVTAVERGDLAVSAAAGLVHATEQATPGGMDRVLDNMVASGEAPTRDAALGELRKQLTEFKPERNPRRSSRKNGDGEPDPEVKAVLALIGRCQDIIEMVGAYAPAFILSGFIDDDMRDVELPIVRRCRDFLSELLEYADAE